jgi:hypothetical protein
LQDDSPSGYKDTLIRLKTTINKKLGWTLFDIDETDFCNLLAFISFSPESDPDVRIINGKEYRRAKNVPDWL